MIDDARRVRLRLASWNVRHFLGVDRRIAPARFLALIAELDPDVIALQELDRFQPRSGLLDQPEWLAEELGMKAFYCETLRCNPGAYGHALLSRLPAREVSSVALPGLRMSEPRALCDVRFDLGSLSVRVLATHLGLSAVDRAMQASAILARVCEDSAPCVLLGDLNAGPGQPGYREFLGRFSDPLAGVPLRARSTWPAPWPFRALDHVLFSTEFTVREVRVLGRGAARFASDHRPVVADAWLSMDADPRR